MLHNILDATNSRKKTNIKNNYIITNTKNIVPPPPPEPVAPNSDIVFTKKIKEVPQAIPNHQSSIPLILRLRSFTQYSRSVHCINLKLFTHLNFISK